MREGAFALIDCLGFKGIWKRAEPEKVLAKLRLVEEAIKSSLTRFPNMLTQIENVPRLKPHCCLLSDTVAISMQFEEDQEFEFGYREEAFLTYIVCGAVIEILDLFLVSDPALILRGCITYGEHLSEGNFIVGPAVDEAAEHMNIAEGAFVWLHPNAASRYGEVMRRMTEFDSDFDSIKVVKMVANAVDEPEILLNIDRAVAAHGVAKLLPDLNKMMYGFLTHIVIDPYPMPVKGGGYLECAVINPLLTAKSPEDRQRKIEIYKSIIVGNRLDLWLKRQNTLAFLQVANRFLEK